jgi:hypothetical protein
MKIKTWLNYDWKTDMFHSVAEKKTDLIPMIPDPFYRNLSQTVEAFLLTGQAPQTSRLQAYYDLTADREEDFMNVDMDDERFYNPNEDPNYDFTYIDEQRAILAEQQYEMFLRHQEELRKQQEVKQSTPVDKSVDNSPKP